MPEELGINFVIFRDRQESSIEKGGEGERERGGRGEGGRGEGEGVVRGEGLSSLCSNPISLFSPPFPWKNLMSMLLQNF